MALNSDNEKKWIALNIQAPCTVNKLTVCSSLLNRINVMKAVIMNIGNKLLQANTFPIKSPKNIKVSKD